MEARVGETNLSNILDVRFTGGTKRVWGPFMRISVLNAYTRESLSALNKGKERAENGMRPPQHTPEPRRAGNQKAFSFSL
ncbi:hypothetical protein F0562_008038 [Nyssa sinensis]|uniref:Uncharacterized protein n=1 Tax=Nyssa sinensis TaxID=561372 RepID=A0A5J5A5T3_9ASTE|nr:hypothetical protein F0562_008038 [Nyssa sinensis]